MTSSLLWEGVREGCGTCEFWLRYNERFELGSCKRYPPTLLAVTVQNNYGGRDYVEVQQHLPTTAEPDWCGEYRRKEPA